MGSLSIWHWLIVLAVGLLLFGGRGKISELMGDVAKGIKAFKKGMSEEEAAAAAAATPETPVKTIDHQPPATDLKRRAETETKVEGSLS
jgi:sec-independent protein translocase protein TatA